MHVRIIGLLIIKDNDLLSQTVTLTLPAPKQCQCYTLAICISVKTRNALMPWAIIFRVSTGTVFEVGKPALYSARNISSQTIVIQVWWSDISTSLRCRLCLLGSFFFFFSPVAAGVFPDAPVETTEGLKNSWAHLQVNCTGKDSSGIYSGQLTESSSLCFGE